MRVREGCNAASEQTLINGLWWPPPLRDVALHIFCHLFHIQHVIMPKIRILPWVLSLCLEFSVFLVTWMKEFFKKIQIFWNIPKVWDLSFLPWVFPPWVFFPIAKKWVCPKRWNIQNGKFNIPDCNPQTGLIFSVWAKNWLPEICNTQLDEAKTQFVKP